MTARENLIATLLRTDLCLAFRSYEIDLIAGDLRSLAPVELNFRRIAARIEEGLAAAEAATAPGAVGWGAPFGAGPSEMPKGGGW